MQGSAYFGPETLAGAPGRSYKMPKPARRYGSSEAVGDLGITLREQATVDDGRAVPRRRLQRVYRRIIERPAVGDGDVGTLRSVIDR